MPTRHIFQQIFIGLSVLLLICSSKNYFAFFISGTEWCQYLCPSVFALETVAGIPVLEQLFAAQKWMQFSSQLVFDRLFTDPWNIFSTVIAAPLIEEFLYRGPMYLTRSHSQRRGWWVIGLFLTVVFALSHGRSGVAIIPLLALGAYNLWLVSRTQRLWPAISLHIMYNFIFTSMMLYQSLWASD